MPGEPEAKIEVVSSTIEQGSVEAKPDPAAELAEIKAKNVELETIARGAVKKAEDAEQYVSQLTTSLTAAAERISSRPGPNDQPAMDIRERLAEDPLSVLDDHFRARTGPLITAVAENNAKLNQEIAKSKFKSEKIPDTDKTLFDIYGEEVDQFMVNMPPETRAQAGSYEAAMQWVRSKHVDDEVALRYQGKIEREKRTFMEAPSSGPGNGRVKPTLNDIEKQVAKGLGLTEAEWLEYKDAGA